MTPRSSVILVALAAGLAATFWESQPVRACSPIEPGIRSREVWPPDGTTNVPMNGRIVVAYGGLLPVGAEPQEAWGADLEIATKDADSSVRVEREVLEDARKIFVVLRPELSPGKTYVVRDRRSTIPCGETSRCVLGPPAVIATFTTGSTVDESPPAFAGLTTIGKPEKNECLSAGGCCTLDRSISFELGWVAAHDDVAGTAVRYNIYDAGDRRAPVLRLLSETMTRESKLCTREGVTLPPPIERYVVRAVDWAGNEDANERSLSPDASCVRLHGVAEPGSGGGCSYAPASAPAAFACASLLAWLAARRRRRR